MGVCDVTVYICDSKNANEKNRCEGNHSPCDYSCGDSHSYCENLLAKSDKEEVNRWNDNGMSKWGIHEEMYGNVYSVDDLYNKIHEFVDIKTSASRNQAILFLRILDLLLLEEGTHVCIWIAS